jgi:high-affinity iron transporter
MTWAEAFPNFLIGLREGLEAGLVVSILLAALRKTAPLEGGRRPSSAPIWLGVLGAVMFAGSFAAVLTFSTSVLSSNAQEAVGGLLSVLAVALVTGMVFWMRRTAATLSKQLRGEVARAAAIGVGALTLTAFLAVGREGLETTLFLWTAVKASGSTLSPLVGAGLGLAAAVVLCWLLFRQAVRINLGVFFNRTALLLIVIAAGVLAYGLGDLQDAGLLPGARWVAFDVSAHVDSGSWWVSIISGITELSPRMTVLQVLAWLVYLAVVIPAFVLAGRSAAAASRISNTGPAKAAVSPVSAAAPEPVVAAPGGPGRWERFAGRRPWAVAGAVVAVPAVVAGVVIAVLPSANAASATTVTVTGSGCADGWSSARSGTQTFTVANKSSKTGEINLVNSAGGVVAEIETIGPATTADMNVTLGGGSYMFKCLLAGQAITTSATVQVTGRGQQATAAIIPVTLAELTGPNRSYQAYASSILAALASKVVAIRADLGRGDLATAKTDWLAAQLDWEQVGASYDSFGDAGVAVDGLPDGLPGGVNDPNFTGLHRLEYGLFHGQSAAQLTPLAARLAADIATVRKNLTSDDIAGDPTNLPLRAHEVLEDALRDHLSELDDQGGGAAYAMTYADTEVTRTVLGELAELITARNKTLVAIANRQLDTLQRALLATRDGSGWQPASQVGLGGRQTVNGAIGSLLQTLSAVPDLLEVPPTK